MITVLDIETELSEICTMALAGKSDMKIELLLAAVTQAPAEIVEANDQKEMVQAACDLMLAVIEMRSAANRYHIAVCPDCRSNRAPRGGV